jgi:hypothetical protein
MKKYFSILFLGMFIIPSIAFASWWNPLSWFNNWGFHKTEPPTQVQAEIQKTPDEKINELQKQVDELKKQKEESLSQESSKSSSVTTSKKPEVIKPKISTDAEINDLLAIFDNTSLQLALSLSRIVEDYDTLLNYSSYYSYEVATTSATLNSLGDDIKNYMDKLKEERSEIVKTKYVDKNYWTTYGIPEIVSKQKEFKYKYNNIIEDFNNSIKNKRPQSNYNSPSYNYPSYNYPSESSECVGVEQKIRDDVQSAGGFATESQIQALTIQKKKELGCY